MKKVVGKLYYSYQYGGLYFIWLRFWDRISGKKAADGYIYGKSKETPPEKYGEELVKIYGLRTGKKLNLKNPITFNEKIQWLKLYDTNGLKTKLADKWLVREWVKEKIGEEYLIPLLGVWDNFDDIKMEELPESFVLKANHGSGCNIIVKNKNNVDWKEVRDKFHYWMKMNYAFCVGFEMQYLNIRPRIIAEQYVENEGGGLSDYKIHCAHGKPLYIQTMRERNHENHIAKEGIYDMNWELQPFICNHIRDKKLMERPVCLDDMLKIATVLSEGFSYVRVDLYVLDNGEIRFGEMTFTPDCGFGQWDPPEADKKMGEKIILSQKRV